MWVINKTKFLLPIHVLNCFLNYVTCVQIVIYTLSKILMLAMFINLVLCTNWFLLDSFLLYNLVIGPIKFDISWISTKLNFDTAIRFCILKNRALNPLSYCMFLIFLDSQKNENSSCLSTLCQLHFKDTTKTTDWQWVNWQLKPTIPIYLV